MWGHTLCHPYPPLSVSGGTAQRLLVFGGGRELTEQSVMCETQGLVHVRLQIFEGLDGGMGSWSVHTWAAFLCSPVLTEGLSSKQT